MKPSLSNTIGTVLVETTLKSAIFFYNTSFKISRQAPVFNAGRTREDIQTG
jgi:hypothetical protein